MARVGNRGARGVQGHALEALAGDGGVGCDRAALAPGSVNFCMGAACGSARFLPVDTAYRSADDLGHASSLLNGALGTWLRARVVV